MSGQGQVENTSASVASRLDRLPFSRFHLTTLILTGLALTFDTLDAVVTIGVSRLPGSGWCPPSASPGTGWDRSPDSWVTDRSTARDPVHAGPVLPVLGESGFHG